METVGVVFLVGDVLDDAELLSVFAAEGVSQRFAWGAVNREVIAVLFLPGLAMIVQDQ